MVLIIGLGNPGEKYKFNRHNVGHMVIDAFKVRPSKLKSYKGLTLLKSDKFMNDSGSFVLAQYTKYHIPYTNLYIIHDDLDIPLGSYKIQFGKGPKDHNGLNDIYEKLGTKDFWHVRVGIDPTSREALRGEEIVLSDFTDDEKKILDGVILRLCNELVTRLKSTN